MKPYALTISVVAIVMADDEQHARDVALSHVREIHHDAWGDQFKLSPATRIERHSDLERIGWDDQCLPYGGDGKTRLSEILKDASDD